MNRLSTNGGNVNQGSEITGTGRSEMAQTSHTRQSQHWTTVQSDPEKGQ